MDAVASDYELAPTPAIAEEARAWLAGFQAHNTEGAALFAMLKDGDRVRVANWVRTRLGPAFPGRPGVTPADGARACALATRIYYATAERELRVALTSGLAPKALGEVLAEPRLACPGLAAVAELAAWAVVGVCTFPATTVALGALQDAIHVWDACRTVWRALDEAGAPQAVGTCLAYVCGRVEEECGFGPGSTLHSLFQQYHAGGLGDREAGLVEDFFQAVHARLRSRTARAADNLAAPGRGGAGPALPSTFAEAALVTADALYTQRTELLFGPHLSATVVCVLYGVARAMDVAVHLKAVTAAVHAAAPHAGRVACAVVELWAGMGGAAAAPHSSCKPAPARLDMRAYYNHHFLGPMKPVLLGVVGVGGLGASPTPSGSPAPAALAKRRRLPLAALTAHDMCERQEVGQGGRRGVGVA